MAMKTDGSHRVHESTFSPLCLHEAKQTENELTTPTVSTWKTANKSSIPMLYVSWFPQKMREEKVQNRKINPPQAQKQKLLSTKVKSQMHDAPLISSITCRNSIDQSWRGLFLYQPGASDGSHAHRWTPLTNQEAGEQPRREEGAGLGSSNTEREQEVWGRAGRGQAWMQSFIKTPNYYIPKRTWGFWLVCLFIYV